MANKLLCNKRVTGTQFRRLGLDPNNAIVWDDEPEGSSASGFTTDQDTLVYGAILKTCNIESAAITHTPSTNLLFLSRVIAPYSGTATKVAFDVRNAGSGLTAGAGKNAIGILDSNRTVLAATAALDTTINSTGLKQPALTAPIELVAGTQYFIAWVFTGSTMPVLAGFTMSSALNSITPGRFQNTQSFTDMPAIGGTVNGTINNGSGTTFTRPCILILS